MTATLNIWTTSPVQHENEALFFSAEYIIHILSEFSYDSQAKDFDHVVDAWGYSDFIFPKAGFKQALEMLREWPDFQNIQHRIIKEVEDGDEVDMIRLEAPALDIEQDLYFYDWHK